METMTLIWHDCETNPPKENGDYLLWYKPRFPSNGLDGGAEGWDKASYDTYINEWYDTYDQIAYGNPDWGYSDFIPYKWAEIDLLEVK